MIYALRWLMSLLFIIQMYLAMVVLAIVFAPYAIASRKGAWAGIHTYCNWVRLSARWMVGLRSEVRGPVPTGEVMIASKHQSFFDIILICSVVPRPKFIMKKELKWAPILGFYAWRIGCIPVDRGKKGRAIAEMKKAVAAGAAIPGQLIIYPQGTRVAPGATPPYKVGSGLLYQQLAQPCIPAATNVGVFWPRHGIYRKPGLAVVEFLPAIPPGRPVADFMTELERVIEGASNRLMADAGFAVARAA
ncbi:lysophospholipid acyltransferase family protein [Paragemmobacter ruber]|uniref:1-acyl-sn-glycerol-3-phosphate acyltransferase n=1 Tax=Paragemmobacter ruber TaxID=1985673 RepID=A0ABW9Y580_9RHOB|nr:lysophospholipid acyltransferase family protein [Rhodobacter ruber]NBE07024.1 1-acyl-sn-glycerol-3-phosphate acyltransferase [Rhodobacter ruber]